MLACNSENKEQNADSKSNTTAFNMQKARALIDSINAKWAEENTNKDGIDFF